MEHYRIRTTIYKSITSLQPLRLDDGQHYQLMSLVNLLDHILVKEYKPSCGQFHIVDRLEVCDFCGADIFQSFFRCDSCLDSAASSHGVTLCAICYVVSRTCHCMNMHSTQCHLLGDLLTAWNTAASALATDGNLKPRLGFNIKPQ